MGRGMILKIVTILWLSNECSGRFIDFQNSLINEYLQKSEIETRNDVTERRWSEDQTRNPRLVDARNSEVEWSTYSVREPNGFGSFAYGYDNVFDAAGNEHFRSEERFENGTVVGGYGYTDKSNKRVIRVSYVADQRGYRARTQVSRL